MSAGRTASVWALWRGWGAPWVGCAGVVLLGTLWGIGSAHAQDGSPVRLSADETTYDRAHDRIHATGDVTISQGDTRLRVDRLTWERATGMVTAEGNVTLEDGVSHLSADSVRLTLPSDWGTTGATVDTAPILDVGSINDPSGRSSQAAPDALTRHITGEIRDGEIAVRGRYFLSGRLISRIASDRYWVADGEFSTCPCVVGKRRPWSIRARTLTIRTPGNLVARGVRFRIRDVPVLYLPVFLFPASERQTGLLLPSFGTDTRNGTRWVQPFYWAISPHQDLTLAVDVRSQRGLGGSLDYRYMASTKRFGELHLSGLRDRDDDRVKGILRWHHNDREVRGWSWFADVVTVNDKDYLRDIATDTEDRTAESLESNLFARHQVGLTSAAVLVRKITDLVPGGDPVVQQLPRLRLERFHGDAPVTWGGYTDAAYLFREGTERALRVDAAPNVRGRQALLGGRLTAQGHVGARWIWYATDATGGGATATESYRVQGRVGGVLDGTLGGHRHRLAPELAYTWIPVNPSDASDFDALERLRREHRVTLGLQQGWRGYDWRLSLPLELDDRRLLPLRSQVDGGAGAVRIHLDTIHRSRTGRPERVVADVTITSRWLRLTAGDVFDRARVGIGTPFSPGFVGGEPGNRRIHVQWAQLALGPVAGWQVEQRLYYDSRDGRFTESRSTVRYGGVCWNVEFVYVDLPDRNAIHFRLGLKGVQAGVPTGLMTTER